MTTPHASPDEYRNRTAYLHSKHAPAMPSDTSQRESKAATGSRQLRDACRAYFRKWERDNGFVAGAGELLVPAGWRE